MRQEGSGWNADRLLREVVYNYYSDAQVFETLRMSEMLWCLLSQFLRDKSKRNKYLDICYAISSTNWKQNNSVARATFLLRVLDFERSAKMRRHARYTNRWAITFSKPAIWMCILKSSGKQEVNWQDTDGGVLLWLPACMCMLQLLMQHFVGEKAGDAGCQVNISHVTVINAKWTPCNKRN